MINRTPLQSSRVDHTNTQSCRSVAPLAHARNKQCTLFVLLVVCLITPSAAVAAIDLLGRTSATFSWDASQGYIDTYDVYVRCAEGEAPGNFATIPTLTIPAESPSVVVSGNYGTQCKVRVVGRDIYGRISPISQPSEVVHFIEPSPPEDDFDGDGFSDIIVQDPNDGGTLLVSGIDLETGNIFTHVRTRISSSSVFNWEIVDTGDFNGDSIPEFLWVSASDDPELGITTYTYLTGSHPFATTIVLAGLTDRDEIIAVGDFNGDGSDDILHRTNDAIGTVYVTFMSPDGVLLTSRYDGALQSQFNFVASGDFNDDGKDDVAWRRSETGQVVLWLMTRPGRMTRSNSGILFGDEWRGETAGNFNNSEEDDILWRNIASGKTLAWYMDTPEAPEEFMLGGLASENWSLLSAGDFDGDGRVDVTWIDDDTGVLNVWHMDETEEAGFRLE